MQQPPMDSGDTYPSHSISAGSGAVDAIDMSHSAAAADDPAETPSKRYSNVARRPTLFRKALVSVGISTKGSRQAWREKVALCWIAAFLSAIVVIFLVFFNSLLCPDNLLDNTVDINAFGDRMDLLLRKAQTINDGTHLLWKYPDVTPDMVNCLIQKYYAGVLSQLPMSCILSRLITIVVSLTVVSILLTRFAMALFFDWFMASHLIRFPKNAPDNHYDTVMSLKLNSQHPLKSHMSKDISIDMRSDMAIPIRPLQRTGTILLRQDPTIQRPVPNPSDLYTVLFVTCYSESESALRTTLDSLASTDYDDCKKILFVVADGIVQGAGNSASTPDLLMRMMHYDYSFGETPRRSLCCSRYWCKTAQYGSCLLRLIQRQWSSHSYDTYYDIFRKIHHLTGVTPDVFDLVLMVDADTRVAPDSLRFMVNAMHNEPRIMGLCGETRIANKKDSWVTMIQVFEYFISHHLGKAFESVFGGVTCLPGCFCMYRIKTIKDGSILPILANPDIIEQYATNETFTLHQKNLLLLGEDRFLTYCKTIVPDRFDVLLSQRRRWINSTVHNLMELVFVNNLCGTFCFSMQFIVFMDLLGTAVLPASLICTYYLIVKAILFRAYTDITTFLNLSLMIVTIFMPMFLVLLTGRRLNYIMWMLLYLLILPIWQIVFPVYSFWHFDDFSWGETRRVTDDSEEELRVRVGLQNLPRMTRHRMDSLMARVFPSVGGMSMNAKLGVSAIYIFIAMVSFAE
ncbi:hypothetical protein BSLG_009583 [Batrachochytrium salamandrivorans]|nr:hypothetical protein BSLG_009583 [Batrachochytrium salamandrivorans]